MLGVMLDCSRNAVLKPESVKTFAKIIKAMGYDTLMLYTEDTYEVENEPLFGYMRGRYSKEELKDIDAYCSEIGIELVPCIQTLAHLNCMFKWNEYKSINDCDDILLEDDDGTYRLIENMLKTVSECFTSHKIHIGMDEAYRVGTGKYQEIHGECDRFDVINNHLHKVCEIADKYGLEPMIWSDMFCKLAAGSGDYYNISDTQSIREKSNLPENISLVYWDYYSTDKQHYSDMIQINKIFGRKVYFAGGAWTWRGLAPDNRFSMETTKAAAEACRECGIDEIFFTIWGDDGAECTPFTVLPSLMYAAEAVKGNYNLEDIKQKFKSIVGCDFYSFMLLDELDMPGGKHAENTNPSKYILYNDLFGRLLDNKCSSSDCRHYAELTERIHNADKGVYRDIFDMYEKLAALLAVKADLGLRTKDAYDSKQAQSIAEVVKDYDVLLDKLEEFHKTYQKLWFSINKPHGFDIQDIRLGGVIQRVKSCKERLVQYMNKEIESIPELEEELHSDGVNHWLWSRIVSANVISHMM